MKKIELGSLVRDKVTNFEGITIGVAKYLTGCDQYLVQPKCEEGVTSKKPVGQWIDSGRLEQLGAPQITTEDLTGDGDGCDIPAPTK